jgi:hypothetical protein
VRLTLALVSAQRHGMFPMVVGLGIPARWAYGLSALANEWRGYVLNHTEPEDLVLFFDAFDVAFQAGEREIVDRYLEMEARSGHELFYNADTHCTNPCDLEKPESTSVWPYLNSGVYLGRARVIRELYKDPLPNPLVDAEGKPMRLQYWHVLFYWAHQEKVAVDDHCELSQMVGNVDNLFVNRFHIDMADQPGQKGLVFVDGMLRNTITNSTPPILHFPGIGHWPDVYNPERVGTCTAWELFRAVHQQEALALEEESSSAKFMSPRPWKAVCSKINLISDIAAIKVSLWGEKGIWVWHSHPEWVAGFLLVAAFAARELVRRRWRSRTTVKAQ